MQDKSISLPPSAEVLCESAVQLFRKTCQQLVDKSISLRSMELLNIRSSMKESARTATGKYRYFAIMLFIISACVRVLQKSLYWRSIYCVLWNKKI